MPAAVVVGDERLDAEADGHLTAGYGTRVRSTRSLVRARKPAMPTPGSRPRRVGVAMSRTDVTA
ncbi:hypothetical protein [Streptomyces sp. NPDC048425]|uniref:hypothetical protein n=1 Tax=Streptomyces sp. NPDC048425 TaxID=3365548 RepID=UPI0037210AE5